MNPTLFVSAIVTFFRSSTGRMVLVLALAYAATLALKPLGISLETLPYTTLAYVLLGIGLYGGVYAISLPELKQQKRVVGMAITVGVLLKTLIIGGLLYAVTGQWIAFLFAVIVAQIDPISVAHLLHGQSDTEKRLSTKAETVLRAWSSFDDPMTVLLGLYLITPLLLSTLTQSQVAFDFHTYLLELGSNLGAAFVLFLLVKAGRSFFEKHPSALMLLLGLAFVICVSQQWMLSIAICGLFIRPNITHLLDRLVDIAFYVATFILGIFLVGGIDWQLGVLLGAFAVISQIIASAILAKDYSAKDKAYLGLSQQNGITSIILSILCEGLFPGTIAVTAPGILVINLLYVAGNAACDRVYRS